MVAAVDGAAGRVRVRFRGGLDGAESAVERPDARLELLFGAQRHDIPLRRRDSF